MDEDLIKHKNPLSDVIILILFLAISFGLWAYGYYD